MPYLIILCKVFCLSFSPVSVEIIRIHYRKHGHEGKQNYSVWFCDPNRLINRAIHFILLIQVIHGAKEQRYIKSVIWELAQICSISLERLDICHSFAVFSENGEITLAQFNRCHIHAFACKGNGVSSRSSANFKNCWILACIAVDIIHRCAEFQLAVPRSCSPSIFVISAIKAAYYFFSGAHIRFLTNSDLLSKLNAQA